jgi:DeoR/GlpR family transcriptional regulator of sugar metabolism
MTSKSGLPSARRQEEISHLILDRGSMTINQLATQFSVSPMTIHRDLSELADQGVIRRFRGGASAQPSGVFESSVRYRMSAMPEAKNAIAKEASTLVEAGMSILLDEGSTTLALANLLTEITPLTVMTSFFETMKLFSQVRGVRLISLGGEYKHNHDSFIGVECIDTLRSLRADIAFMSTSAVDAGTAYHQEQEIVLVKRAMMQSANYRVLLVDHSKLGRIALHRFADLNEFDLMITDADADESQVADLVSHDVNFRVAQFGKRTPQVTP